MKTPSAHPSAQNKIKAPLNTNVNPLTVILLVIIFLLAISLVFVGREWYQLTSDNVRTRSVINPEEWLMLKNNVTLQNSELAKQQSQLLLLERQIQRQNSNDYLGVTRTLEDAAYLLNTADLYLTVNHNPATAIELLKMAKYRLDSLNSTELSSAKRAVTHDLTALTSVKTVDVAEIIASLSAINNKCLQLKQLTPAQDFTKKNSITNIVPNNETNTALPWYQKALSSFAGLKDLIIIRRVNEPIKPLLTTAEIRLLQQNITLLIAQARSAVLTQNKNLYSQSLVAIRQQLKSYPPQADLTAIEKSLDELSAIDIAPSLPSLRASIKAVSNALTSQQSIDLNSPPTTTNPATQETTNGTMVQPPRAPPNQSPAVTQPAKPASPALEI